MLVQNMSEHSQSRTPLSDGLIGRWARGIGLAAAMALAYFLAAQLSLGLLLKPDGVAVFWPAAGISSGALIALGPRARWPVAAGTIIATFVANILGDRSIWASAAFALCNAAEALITAGLIQHYFAAGFGLDRLRHVLGLLAAAVAGTAISGIGGAISYKLFHAPTAPMVTTWRHWFASDGLGIIAVAPLVIGLAAAIRQPPPRKEMVEGVAALLILAVMTGFTISLPQEPWQTVAPGALLLPVLLWLAARCRPVFAAAGAFIVSLTIVWTAIFGIGHFGDTSLPIEDRILQAQAVILVVTLGAFVLAALFAERRQHEAELMQSEARLLRLNLMLERERDNKLMNAQAITASIAHEIKQPLAAIVINANAAERFLDRTPPDHDEVRAILKSITADGLRTSEVFDSIRALFRKSDQGRQVVDINAIIIEALQSLRRELEDHEVQTHHDLASELPLIDCHKNQVQQVVTNLIHNAIEAMAGTTGRNRELRVRTELDGQQTVVTVRDSGPGIDPKQIDGIFAAFFTTKTHGMGLGLAICRMIIEQHGGHLTASSDGSNGALFRFSLPTRSAVSGAGGTG